MVKGSQQLMRLVEVNVNFAILIHTEGNVNHPCDYIKENIKNMFLFN